MTMFRRRLEATESWAGPENELMFWLANFVFPTSHQWQTNFYEYLIRWRNRSIPWIWNGPDTVPLPLCAYMYFRNWISTAVTSGQYQIRDLIRAVFVELMQSCRTNTDPIYSSVSDPLDQIGSSSDSRFCCGPEDSLRMLQPEPWLPMPHVAP